MNDDELLKLGLEHGRSMFIYHAGQRHGSLNFYFGVLAAFVAGFVALFTADKLWALSQPVAPVIATVLGLAAILITILFGLLDIRNADLVKCDEKLVARIERELSQRSRPIPEFETIKASDHIRKKLFRYQWIVKRILVIFGVVWILAIVASWTYWNYARNLPKQVTATLQKGT